MYELRVQRHFSAAHALRIRGEREPLHGHDWHVTLVVAGLELDEDGLLCDFHQLEWQLDDILAPFRNANLNETPAFRNSNPSAERVAEFIGQEYEPTLPPGVHLVSVAVTEAPGCTAIWRSDAFLNRDDHQE